MIFNSLVFLLFAVLFFLIWPFIQNFRVPKWIFLIIASFSFYAWWDWRFLSLIVYTGILNFYIGKLLYKNQTKKKLYLIIAICGNLATLATFKYLGFLLGNFRGLTNLIGIKASIPVVQLALPIGISFYTFQAMSYVFDIYKGYLKPTNNIFHFFAYLALFPQLVAGPIVRASHLLPQLKENKIVSDNQIWEAIKLISFGYFKKVVLADNLGRFVDAAFARNNIDGSAPFWWIIITFFAIQIYCDFSGYSDIAIGLGKLMGYDFPRNFNHPYLARSMQDFWSRWHISLTTWFRDYLFFPLLSRKINKAGAHRSMWITMLVSGLWHGAAWTFVIWGGLHAFYYSIEKITNWPKKIGRIPGGKHLSVLITIFLTWISWVFFRATSFKQAVGIIGNMFNLTNLTFSRMRGYNDIISFVLIIAFICELFAYFKLKEKIEGWKIYPWLETVLVALTIVACVYLRGPGQAFIYFQF